MCSLEVARGTLRGAHSPAGRALRAFPAAPARAPLARPLCREFAPAWPCRGRRGVVPLSLPLLPPLRQPWRPAPAGFIRSPLPRVKRRVVCKSPQGRGRGQLAAKGPGIDPSTPSPAPPGPKEPTWPATESLTAPAPLCCLVFPSCDQSAPAFPRSGPAVSHREVLGPRLVEIRFGSPESRNVAPKLRIRAPEAGVVSSPQETTDRFPLSDCRRLSPPCSSAQARGLLRAGYACPQAGAVALLRTGWH